MYAIVQTGGKQIKVAPGDIVEVEKLAAEAGEVVTLGEVLLTGDEEVLRVGTPFLEKTAVKAKVLAHGRGPKVIIFKLKKRKNYRRKNGHRQDYTRLKIEEIVVESN